MSASVLNPFTGDLQLLGLDYVSKTSNPSTADTGYAIPSFWLNSSTKQLFMYVAAGQWEIVTGSVTSTSDPGSNTTYPVPFFWLNTATGSLWTQLVSGTWTLLSSTSGPTWNTATVTTTDATVTTLLSYALTSSTNVRICGQVGGALSDYSAVYNGSVWTAASRSSGGTSAISGTAVVNEVYTTSGAPTVTSDVSSNALRIRVTGVAATTIAWKIWYQAFIQS